MSQRQPKLITNAIAFKKCSNLLPSSTWTHYGELSIPFCNNRKIFLNEFKKIERTICNAFAKPNHDLIWIINIIDPNEYLDDQGNAVNSHGRIKFVLGDMIDSEGNRYPQYRDSILHALVTFWEYKIVTVKSFDSATDDFLGCLGVSGYTEGYGLDNEVHMSNALNDLIFGERMAKIKEDED